MASGASIRQAEYVHFAARPPTRPVRRTLFLACTKIRSKHRMAAATRARAKPVSLVMLTKATPITHVHKMAGVFSSCEKYSASGAPNKRPMGKSA